jgi:uncharacterized protein (TIGR02588 family)
MGTRAERIEWIGGGVSALVVLAMIGFFVWESIAGEDRFPELAVSAEPVEDPAGGAHLRYRIENSGGRAATGVMISVGLADGTRRSVIVDAVPPHSEVTGGIYVPEGLAPGAEIVVDGYVDP